MQNYQLQALALALLYPDEAFVGSDCNVISVAVDLVNRAREGEEVTSELNQLLSKEELLNEWVEKVGEDPERRPPHLQHEAVRGQVGNTRLFVRVSGIASARDSLLAAALTYANTQSVPYSTGAGLANEVRTRVKRLSEDEVVVFDTLRRLAAGALYQVWIEQDRLLSAMIETSEGEASRVQCLGLLRSMRLRGLLEESAGGFRAVR